MMTGAPRPQLVSSLSACYCMCCVLLVCVRTILPASTAGPDEHEVLIAGRRYCCSRRPQFTSHHGLSKLGRVGSPCSRRRKTAPDARSRSGPWAMLASEQREPWASLLRKPVCRPASCDLSFCRAPTEQNRRK
jgi:hypothetical protein